MSNRQIFKALTIAGIVLCCCGTPSDVEFGYLPFDSETLVAISTHNFDQVEACTFSLPFDSPEAQSMRALLADVPTGHFDDTVVRLRIVGLLGPDLYVDQLGGLARSGGQPMGKLSGQVFASLRETVGELAKERCDPELYGDLYGDSG